MSSSNTIDFTSSTFNQLDQKKKSHLVAGLMLTVVVLLHTTLMLFLSNASKTDFKKPPVIMEVVMLPTPEPIVKPVAKEPPPAPPQVKTKPIKPKPIVKPPEPVKKPVVVKKPVPVPAPKPKPTPTEVKEVIPVPKFEPVPNRVTAPPLVTPPAARASAASSHASTAAKTTGNGRDDSKSVVSGVVPLLRVPPRYPPRAASRQIEGWVKVEFTIQTDGSVDNAVVVDSDPKSIFDDAALTAISKWKFKEKIVNGVAVPQRAVQRLQFKLNQ